MIYLSIFCSGYSSHNFKFNIAWDFQDFQGFNPAQLSVKSNHGKKKKWCQEAKKGVHLRCKLTISEIIQDLEGFSWDLGFVRDSRKRKISWRGTGFDHNSASGIPQNLRSGCGVGKENGIRNDKDDRSSSCGIVVTAKDPPFQTLTTVFIRISAHPKGRKS